MSGNEVERLQDMVPVTLEMQDTNIVSLRDISCYFSSIHDKVDLMSMLSHPQGKHTHGER
jgi:hypothetical protein